MNFTFSDYQESADFLRGRLNGFVPEVLLILGSGLGFLGDKVDSPVFVDYGAIPHFRPSTAPDHKGRFVFGTLRGRRVAVMQGRMHCYEGYSMEDAAYAVRVLRLLGAGKLIVTNAHRILGGQALELDQSMESDFIFIDCPDDQAPSSRTKCDKGEEC